MTTNFTSQDIDQKKTSEISKLLWEAPTAAIESIEITQANFGNFNKTDGIFLSCGS